MNFAALALGLLTLIAARPALALDIELPGERTLMIHGFYESRLRFIGEDLPFGGEGVTYSQFRHVLDLETELDFLPEGWGVFDTLFFFSRWVFSYECIYDDSCGLFNSADSFGSDHRNPFDATRNPQQLNRMPKNLKSARVPAIDAGGVFPLKFRPGTLLPIRDELNPGFRYQNCFNDSGVVANPNPLLGAFCNLNDRSILDGPIDEFQGVDLFQHTRAGAFNTDIRLALLRGGRSDLGESRFSELQQQLFDGEFLSPGEQGLVRALNATAERLRQQGKDAEAQVLADRADLLQAGTFDDPDTTEELLTTRPDANLFEELAQAKGRPASTLLTSLWGASQLKDFILPVQATLDTDIAPLGYFTQDVGDIVPHFAVGLTDDTERPRSARGGLTTETVRLGAVPFLVGPDGIRNTEDDLPFLQQEKGMRVVPAGDPGGPDPVSDFESAIFVMAGGTEVELYRITKDSVVLDTGCEPTAGGLNKRGKCIELAVSDLKSVDPNTGKVEQKRIKFETLEALGNLDFRPSESVLEPLDLTDFRMRALQGGRGLPARPPNPDGGLYYKTQGVTHLIANSSRLVSSLDVQFTEDELRWGHGASDDEHEFREGYLEFEMFDGNFFARAGKLILVWGKTELFRNQDRNNPLDISNGVITRLEESRIGQWMVDMVYSPEQWMRVGPVEDLRLELAVIFDDFQPIDLGPCGENTTLALVCLKSFGAMASGLAGLGLVGEVRPDRQYSGLKQFDYGIRLEGRWDRFTFAVTNFWGWDDVPYVDLVHQYGRRVDPNTGAPVNVTGPLECTHRTDSGGRRVGPNGEFDDDYEDDIPSMGNCLLFDNPEGDAAQPLRASDQIALNHFANQTLFHTICTLTFDADNGYCAVDILNDPDLFPVIANILASEFFADLATDGLRFIRIDASPFRFSVDGDVMASLLFKPLKDNDGLGVALTDTEKALLGCGPAFASPCAGDDRGDAGTPGTFLASPSLRQLLGIGETDRPPGGIDLMNADASVLTQEFMLLKEGSPGALVGVRGFGAAQQYFEAGIQHNGLTPEQVIALGPAGREAFEVANNDPSLTAIPTDAWIEPLPWLPDPNQLAKGVLVYQVANRNEFDPRCEADPTLPFCINGVRTRNDPTDSTNPANVFRGPDPDNGLIAGESCIAGFGDGLFDRGCTELEKVTANFERLAIALEIIGADRVPDPPESLVELENVLSDSFLLQFPLKGPDGSFLFDADGEVIGGDPISGPDGIFVNNLFTGLGLAATESQDPNGTPVNPGSTLQDVFDLDEYDTHVVRNELVPGGNESIPGTVGKVFLRDFTTENLDDPDAFLRASRTFMRDYDPTTCEIVPGVADDSRCHLVVGSDPGITQLEEIVSPELRELVTTLPVALQLFDRDLNNFTKINFLKLFYQNPQQAMDLLEAADPLEPFVTVTIDGVERTFIIFGNELTFALGGDDPILEPCQKFNGSQVCDWDQDGDGVYDGADDYTPGPATDDNLLCGSGLPGDDLQGARQTDLAHPDDRQALADAGGLPPRSPVFCRSLVGLLGATHTTLGIKMAGGDGTYGRRDFIWHAGRQVSLNYQKRNVFGFALDFAEDVTKTSWGIEFTWTANKYFRNLNSFSGLKQSDESILSISVDRPTFINYLNPNRSFFLNFQFFIRYLSDYSGGRDDQDGSYGVAEGPLDTRMVFTFFTGYFQDRLQPRVTMLYDPTTSNGGVLSQIQYRWTEAFSTTIGYNNFFGRPRQVQQSYHPIGLRTNTSDTTSEALTRTLAPVVNEDFGFITVRFSF